MSELIDCIKDKTVENSTEIQESINSMLCFEDDYISLSQTQLLDALHVEGEFLVLKLHYDDFADELKSEKIKYKMSQSLSVVVSYEEDSSSYNNIKQFLEYITENTDPRQNAIFGIKKVKELSKYPITILFSGILPINQLKMTVGTKIDKFIHSDDKYFKPKFQEHRDSISKEIGIPLLPVLPILDENLEECQIRLVDLYDSRVISQFEINENLNEETVDLYLLKLFYIYKVLAQEKQCKKHLH